MHFHLTIASGKGGTGKTTVSVGLLHYFSQVADIPVQLVDCDVEEPNDSVFFPSFAWEGTQQVYKSVPEIDPARCTYCRKCVDYCEFNAITIIPPIKYAAVNKELCHACGACLEACEFDAIKEIPVPVGAINTFANEHGIRLTEGRLDIGSTMQTMLIRETKKRVIDEGLILFDAPPGTSCPVVETISGSDFVVVVTEPTPFALHDMKIIVDILETINIPFGIIINKTGTGNNEIYKFIKQRHLNLIAELPYSRKFAEAYSRGTLLVNMPDEIQVQLQNAVAEIRKFLV